MKYAALVVLSAVCGWLISFAIPEEYAAQAKIADEYKTTDLLIGLNSMNVMMRDLNGSAGNEGTDDIVIYAKFLSSEDFIEQVGRIYLPEFKQDYLHYLGKQDEEDAKEHIRTHVRYNISSRSQTVELQVLDRNAKVAGEVLDQTLAILKNAIEQFRCKRAIANRENALNRRKAASEEYHKAGKRYNDYQEAHLKPSSDYVSSQLDVLQKDYQKAYEIYNKAAEEYVRADYLTKKENTSFAVVKKYNLSQKPMSPTRWAYALAAAVIALLVCLCHAHFKNKDLKTLLRNFEFGGLFSPWSITFFIWLIILGLYYLLDTELYPITHQFYYSLIIWLPIFFICALITYNADQHQKKENLWNESLDLNKTIFNVFFVLSLIITPLYVYRVLQIVMMFSTDDLMNNVRVLALYGEGPGLLSYSIVINQSLFVVALWAHPKVPTWQVVALAIACLMNSLAIMEKGLMFFVFSSIVFVLFEKKVIKLRSILIYSGLLIVIFYLFNLGRAEEGSQYQEEETLLDFFAMYALSPPVAFCQLTQDLTPQFGTNTFEKIYVFLARFGVSDIVVKEKLQEFVWVPIPTNVYTCFHPFFVDFGYKGIAFFSAIYGCVSGWLYRLYRNKNGIGCALYTYAVFALVLQFYQENFFQSLVFLTQFTFFVALFTQKKVRLSLYHRTP